VVAAGTTFDEPLGFDLAAFWTAWAADFERRQPACDVVVDLGPDVVDDVGRALGDEAGRRARAARPGADGRRRVTLRFTSPEAARHRLAGLGDRLRVIEPVALRRELADLARRTLEAHGDEIPAGD
jgi:predicted DNA-binding transcriptional regulator YafY